MLKKSLNGKALLLLVLSLSLSLGAVAQKKGTNLNDQVLAAMKRATQFMMDTVSYNGGFVWQYLPDFSRSWGEMEAKRTMVWVQPPGTPAVGHLLLDAYHATGDEFYYEAARKVANALIWGQLPCGGWNYIFDFAGEASLKDWYATIGANGWRLEEFQHYYGNATFDDSGTAMSAKFLLRMYVEKYDPVFKPALDRAIQFVLDSQYPIGGWPQRYPLMYDFSHHGKPDYSSFITLNDDVAGENIEFLVMCYQTLGEQRIMDPINRAMHCLLLLQQGSPRPGFADQYTLDLKPSGARTYEPTGLTTAGTVSNIRKLIGYYKLSGDTKYLAGIPAAIDWLESLKLPDSEVQRSGRRVQPGQIMVPRFIDPNDGKPLYVHRTGSNAVSGYYYIDQEISNTVGHYSSQAAVNIDQLRKEYEDAKALSPEEASQGSPLKEKGLVPLEKYFTSARGGVDTQAAQELVKGLNPRGYWPTPLNTTSNPYIGPGPKEATPGNYLSTNVGDKWDTSPYRAEDPVMGISTTSYVQNMMRLIKFIDPDGQ
jgi:PelA/Pel-15E family pectate lyase